MSRLLLEPSKYSYSIYTHRLIILRESPNHAANPVNKLTACRRICTARRMQQTSFFAIHDEANKRDSSSAHPIIQFNRPAPSSHRDPLQRRIKTESCSLSVQAEILICDQGNGFLLFGSGVEWSGVYYSAHRIIKWKNVLFYSTYLPTRGGSLWSKRKPCPPPPTSCPAVSSLTTLATSFTSNQPLGPHMANSHWIILN